VKNSSILGWSLLVASSIFLILISSLIFSVGIDEATTRILLRFTSVTSAIPFLLVFLSKPFSYSENIESRN
jgi:hypothetical protein